jgi:hypothetical protein
MRQRYARSTKRTAAATAVVGNRHCIAHMATTHCSEVRAEMPSGMGPLRELEESHRYLHPGGHIPGYSRVPSHPTHSTHASASCELRSTRSTAVPAPGGHGHCVAHMATTHCSEVRAEMPSGKGPIRLLKCRPRFLHPGGHIPGYNGCDDHSAQLDVMMRAHAHTARPGHTVTEGPRYVPHLATVGPWLQQVATYTTPSMPGLQVTPFQPPVHGSPVIQP